MKICAQCKFENDDDTLFCSECGAKMGSESEVVKTKKIMPRKKWILGGVGIVALVLIVTIFNPINILSNKTVILYQKDYELNISRISKLLPVEVTKKLWNDEESSSVVDLENGATHLSADMKTLYYMDKSDEDTSSFYMMKLKSSNLEKNEVVKVDSDIYHSGTYMTEDGKLFIYVVESDSTLMIYNQKESLEIDDEVQDYFVNYDEKSMYYFKEDGSIYYVSLDNIEETNKITSSYSDNLIDYSGNLYYLKDGKLYLSKSGSDPEKIDSDIYELTAVTAKGVFYTKEIQEEVKLSNYVFDDMKDSDANMVMPMEPDVYDYYEQVMVESYFGNYWDESINYDKYYAAYDKYNEKMDDWYDMSYRDEMRAELGTRVLTLTNYALYFNDGTNETLVTDHFNNSYENESAYNIDGLVYNKYDISSIEKMDLSQISSLSDVENRIISMSSDSKELFVSIAGSEIMIEQENYSHCYTSGDAIFILDNYDDNDESGDLTKFTFDKNGKIVAEVVDDDVNRYRILNESNKLIYFKDKDKDEDSGTLYMDGVEIASDVNMNLFYNVENSDKILYLVDYEDNAGTLCFHNNGKETEIGDDVSNFKYVNDKHILFLEDYSPSDETYDLMLFNGKDVEKVDKEVQYLISGRNNNYSR